MTLTTGRTRRILEFLEVNTNRSASRIEKLEEVSKSGEFPAAREFRNKLAILKKGDISVFASEELQILTGTLIDLQNQLKESCTLVESEITVLNSQIEKHQDMCTRFTARARMAEKLENFELLKQATQREQQYSIALGELQKSLDEMNKLKDCFDTLTSDLNFAEVKLLARLAELRQSDMDKERA